MKKDAYAKAGVDVKRVRKIQDSLAASLAGTFSNRRGRFGTPLMGIGHYAGLIDIGGGRALAMHTDGVGTKVQLAVQMDRYETIGIDCVAMTVNDLICVGAEPVALLDYIALEREDESLVSRIMVGLIEGARRASTAIVGGETAIMGSSVKGFDLVSMGVGVVKRKKVLDGSAIAEGALVVGVASSGLHSNGYTLARSVLQARHPLQERLDDLGSTLGDAMLAPTSIYVKPALEALRKREVHALGHITGGSFRKLTRLVGGRDLGFSLELPPPPPIFRMIQTEGGLSDSDMLRTFNMGVGLCAVVPAGEAGPVARVFQRSGFPATEIGVVSKGPGVRVGGLRLTD
jgi:phosphoribosylformylglycinamidine cyclo-ligase